MSRIHVRALVTGLTLTGGCGLASAAPNVYWHHVHTALSQADCLKRAETVMLADKTGRIVKDNDSVRSWSEKTAGIVECLKVENGVFAMVLVASDDAQEASVLQDKLEKAVAAQ